MSTISNLAHQGRVHAAHGSAILAFVRRWWLAYMDWRLHQLAANQLWRMSDRELKDIGLTRAEIEPALRGDFSRDRTLARYY